MDQLVDFFSPVNYLVVVRSLAFLFFIDWLCYLPFFRVAFSRRDEGSGFKTNSKASMVALATLWLFAIGALFFEQAGVRAAGAAVLFGIFRQHYIHHRWTSVRRGFGAPGFMSHWVMLYIFLLETTRLIDGTGAISHLLFITLKWDFGWIMICAGTYKFLSGYAQSDGMEYGQANPMWGYFWKFFSKRPPSSHISRYQNLLACAVELTCGILMILPVAPLQTLGAVGISLSFFYVALLIRLGRLAILMAVAPALFLPSVEQTFITTTSSLIQAPQTIVILLSAVLWLFIVTLPFVKVMQYVNLFLNRRFPAPVQNALGFMAARLPIIMWRVFTPDVTNFFIRVYGCDSENHRLETLVDEDRYSALSWNNPQFKLRMLHVTESIAITSVFTTLRYFPSDRPMFEKKLVSYARSLSESWNKKFPVVCFEYVAMIKQKDRFDFREVGDFYVNLDSGSVSEAKKILDYNYAAPSQYSPVRESAVQGTYLPKAP